MRLGQMRRMVQIGHRAFGTRVHGELAKTLAWGLSKLTLHARTLSVVHPVSTAVWGFNAPDETCNAWVAKGITYSLRRVHGPPSQLSCSAQQREVATVHKQQKVPMSVGPGQRLMPWDQSKCGWGQGVSKQCDLPEDSKSRRNNPGLTTLPILIPPQYRS